MSVFVCERSVWCQYVAVRVDAMSVQCRAVSVGVAALQCRCGVGVHTFCILRF